MDHEIPRAMGIVDCGQYPDDFAVGCGMVEKRRNEPAAFADVRHVFVQFGLRLYQLDEAGKTAFGKIIIKLQRSSENPVSGFRRPFAYPCQSACLKYFNMLILTLPILTQKIWLTDTTPTIPTSFLKPLCDAVYRRVFHHTPA